MNRLMKRPMRPLLALLANDDARIGQRSRPEGRDAVVAERVRMNLNAGWRFWLGG